MSIAEPPTPTISAPSVVPTIGTTDGELLLRFSKHGCQQSFAQLVDSHGPLVWATCRQVLCHHDDIEDAFQATFLILARRASDIRASDSAAPWLYRVAYRTSLALWRQRRARPTLPLEGREVLDDRPDPLEHLHQQRMVAVLVEELRALPSRYQTPLVLCYLEGRSRQAVAEQLDCTVATVKGRLARGRQLLRQRLHRRGVALSVAAGAAAAAVAQAETAVAGSPLPAATASAATTPPLPSGESAVSATVSQLVQQGVSTMTCLSLLKPGAVLVATLLVGVATASIALDQPKIDPSTEIAVAADQYRIELQTEPKGAEDSDYDTESSASPAVTIARTEDPSPVSEPLPSESNLAVSTRTMSLEEWIAQGRPDNPPGTQPMMAAPPTQELYTIQGVGTGTVRSNVVVARDPSQPVSVPLPGERGLMQLQLMQKHWQAKAEGLRLKADALARQAEQDKDPMKIAEAKLAEAESYQADAERIAVEAQITRRQATPVQVDPAPGMLGVPAPQGAPLPSANPPGSPPSSSHPAAGQPLQIVIDQNKEGQQQQMVLTIQIDKEGKISLPGMIDGPIKIKNLQDVEEDIKQHIIKKLESSSKQKVKEGDIRVKVLRRLEINPVPSGDFTYRVAPGTVAPDDPEKQAMRQQIEVLRRELEAARQQSGAVVPTYTQPGTPPAPAYAPVLVPTPPNSAPDREEKLRGDIEKLREQVKRLEERQSQAEKPVDSPVE